MNPISARTAHVSRRGFLQAAAGGAVALGAAASSADGTKAARGPAATSIASADHGQQNIPNEFRDLDGSIREAMARYQIVGVAVAATYRGHEFVRGYGVTNVDYPLLVDGDTLFRACSVTKTFTGTVIARLVEQGLIDMEAPVRTYLPSLKLADESVAASVTVRQLLNHSAGWDGEDYSDYGRGDDAIERYAADMDILPQLTPLGEVYSYNNAAVVLAGRLIEVVTGQRYEEAVQTLLLDPLGLDHSFFYAESIIGYNVAASHSLVEGEQVVRPGDWYMPRAIFPTGGLISSARDQLRWLRFHMTDGSAREGPAFLSPVSIRGMRTNLGPGFVSGLEFDGVGVTWFRRTSAEGITIFQHSGDYAGYHTLILFVPDRELGLAMLTNSDGGDKLIADLQLGDVGALSRFGGLSNTPAPPLARTTAELAPYVGRYRLPLIGNPEVDSITLSLVAVDGRLLMRRTVQGAEPELDAGVEPESAAGITLAFYRDDAVVVVAGGLPGVRADFAPVSQGRVPWFRWSSRTYLRQD